jgi:hypothetical protein
MAAVRHVATTWLGVPDIRCVVPARPGHPRGGKGVRPDGLRFCLAGPGARAVPTLGDYGK